MGKRLTQYIFGTQSKQQTEEKKEERTQWHESGDYGYYMEGGNNLKSRASGRFVEGGIEGKELKSSEPCERCLEEEGAGKTSAASACQGLGKQVNVTRGSYEEALPRN